MVAELSDCVQGRRGPGRIGITENAEELRLGLADPGGQRIIDGARRAQHEQPLRDVDSDADSSGREIFEEPCYGITV